MPTLVFYYPDKEKRWKVEVEQSRFTIGRSRDAEVCVPHSSVSKKHILIERRGPRYFFRDLGSKNGIYLNEFRKARGSLSDGDELRLGSIRVTFYRATLPASAPQPPAAPAAPAALLEDAQPDTPVDGSPRPDTATSETIAVPAEVVPPVPPGGPGAEEAEAPPLDLDLDLDDIDLELPPEGDEGSLDVDGPDAAEGIEDEEGVVAPVTRPQRPPVARAAPLSRAKRSETPAPRRLSLPVLLAGAVGFVGLGLFLGHLGSLFDETPTPGESAETETVTGASPNVAPARPAAPGTAPPAGEAPSFSPPADLGDGETRARLGVRLHLDLLDRPPTRDELENISTYAHDRLWHEVVRKANFRPGGTERVFTLFMGRKPRAGEAEAIFATAGRDMDHFAFMVGTSKDYASAAHRRKRSMRQLTRSLIVNLLDLAPGAEASAKVLGEIEDSKGAVGRVAKAMALHEESRAGPRPAEPPDRWLAGAYERLLLRKPTAEEKRRGIEVVAAREGGWRDVLAELAARDEYLEY